MMVRSLLRLHDSAVNGLAMTGDAARIITFVLALALLAGILGCGAPAPKALTEAESREIARDFLVNAPTFKYDGMAGSLKFLSSRPLDKPASWEFVFEFTSAHSGYGERTGQILLQVLTPHTTAIKVENGKVTSAVLDEKWDELNQKMVQ